MLGHGGWCGVWSPELCTTHPLWDRFGITLGQIAELCTTVPPPPHCVWTSGPPVWQPVVSSLHMPLMLILATRALSRFPCIWIFCPKTDSHAFGYSAQRHIPMHLDILPKDRFPCMKHTFSPKCPEGIPTKCPEGMSVLQCLCVLS